VQPAANHLERLSGKNEARHDETIGDNSGLDAALCAQIQHSAQAQERQQGQDACGRDSTRLCKAVINDGDQAVLACLKQNRAKLRAVCVKFLQEKGQL